MNTRELGNSGLAITPIGFGAWAIGGGDYQFGWLAWVERLKKVGQQHGCSPGEVAIAWTLRNPVVTGAIVGARNARQVVEIAGGAGLRLTSEEIKEIEGSAK